MSVSRTTYLLAVLVAACLAAPAWADDLATTVAAKLQDSGALTGFRVNVKSKSGTVWLEGRVSDERQLATAVGIAESTPGVERVVNRLVIGGQAPAAAKSGGFGLPASMWSLAGAKPPAEPRAEAAAPAQEGPLSTMTGMLFAGGRSAQAGGVQLAQATQPAGRMPRGGAPRPMQPQQRTAMRTVGMGDTMALPSPGGYGGYDGPVADGQMVPGTMQYSEGYPADAYAQGGAAPGGAPMMNGGPGGPMPMGGAGVGMPPVPMRADGPNMPNYAWPSYAASPNYAALQYPTQYSPTAWPYIGPFYPYPQVPLGWRRVSLEWDDGWWWLDFDERHIHSHHR
ncbi:MAG: hypothetical protein RLZZ440_1714 [Planctomycetota bacterium]